MLGVILSAFRVERGPSQKKLVTGQGGVSDAQGRVRSAAASDYRTDRVADSGLKADRRFECRTSEVLVVFEFRIRSNGRDRCGARRFRCQNALTRDRGARWAPMVVRGRIPSRHMAPGRTTR